MENWILIVAITFIILYGLGLYLWNKKVSWRLNKRFSKWIRHLHYTLSLLAITAGVLNYVDDISFRGLWTTNLIIIGLLISGVLIYPLSEWSGRPRFEKYYFKLFACLPIVTASILLIPLIGFMIVVVLFGRLTAPAEKIYY